MLTFLSILKNSYGYDTTKISKYSENLNRGVVAVRAGNGISFISWRFLITDDDSIAFNVYRIDENSTTVKLNSNPITDVTHFYDKNHNKSKSYKYFVGSIINDVEVENSSFFELPANTTDIPCIRIPIHNGTQFRTVWVGDLDGDRNLDFVLVRDRDEIQTVEAYLHNGTYLWTLNLGHNSINKDRIKPGATTINVGQVDGLSVYDLNGDGKAEVYIRIANNFTFGDGYVFIHDNDVDQWIACIDGLTGKLKQKVKLPNFKPEYGSVSAQFGVGWATLEKPALFVATKNRITGGKRFFNIYSAFSFINGVFGLDWNFTDSFDNDDSTYHNRHHFRLADVDYDGIDEFHEIGFTLNGNGTLRYNLGKSNIRHGDRFYVSKFNKEDTTMSGYGIQQNNPDLIDEYAYNASTGEMKWIHYGTYVHDLGRGNAGDFDPSKPGYEVYSFDGLYNEKTNDLLVENFTDFLWPANNLYWEGTLSPSTINRGLVIKFDDENNKSIRYLTSTTLFNNKYGTDLKYDDDGDYPLFHGDILGDWREEFIMAASNWSEIVIFTTNLDTNLKMTTLWHDPGMRASMTINGYKQSHMPLVYLGNETNLKENRDFLKKYHKLRAEKPEIPTSEPSSSSPSTPPTNQTNISESNTSSSGKSKTTVAIVVSLVIIALIAVAAFFVVRFIINKRSNNDNITETALIV